MAPALFSRLSGPPQDRQHAAVYWSARRRLGLATAREESQFQAWLADPQNDAAFAAVDQPIELAGDLASLAQIREMREAALAKYPAHRRISKRQIALGGLVAASIVGAVAVGAHFARPVPAIAPSATNTATVAAAEVSPQRFSSKTGERLNVPLEDGSVVTLNTASTIEVAYTKRLRLVRLLQGQAFFEVAKHQVRPFVVAAGDRQITATGTAFDVRLDRGQVKVVLVEGHVVVQPLARSGLQALIPALSQQALSPGEQLVVTPARTVSVSATDVERDLGWNRGQVIFRDDTLQDAVTEMNRYSNDELVINDPRVARLRISGVFRTSTPEGFRTALAAYYPLKVEQRSQGVQALVWNNAQADN